MKARVVAHGRREALPGEFFPSRFDRPGGAKNASEGEDRGGHPTNLEQQGALARE